MNRRRFFSVSGAAAAALGASPPPASAAPTKALMKLGCQSAPTNETHLKYLARYGVRHICGYPEIADGRLYATVDELKRMRDLAEKNGISVDCIAPPFLESSHIDREKHPAIMLAQSPERDRDIEATADAHPQLRRRRHSVHQVQHEHPGRAALPAARPGRGDATLQHLAPEGRASQSAADARRPRRPPIWPGSASPISWSASSRWPTNTRSAWPATRTTPACRPKAIRAWTRVLGTVDGLKKFVSIQESPYHGLNFCQGTVSRNAGRPRQGDLRRDPLLRHAQEDLQRPLPQYPRPPQRFRRGLSRTKATSISCKAIQVYKEVGYPYLLMPDHVPVAPNDPNGLQSFAFCYGYIRALIQAVVAWCPAAWCPAAWCPAAWCTAGEPHFASLAARSHAAGQVNPSLPAPAGDQSVDPADVPGGERVGRAAGHDRGVAQHPRPDRGGQRAQPAGVEPGGIRGAAAKLCAFGEREVVEAFLRRRATGPRCGPGPRPRPARGPPRARAAPGGGPGPGRSGSRGCAGPARGRGPVRRMRRWW